MAMAETYRDRVKANLRHYEHAPFTKTPSPEGGFPAWIGGDLARSVWITPGLSSGMRATASVAPHTIYARLQELGGNIHAKNRKFLMWKTTYPTNVTNFAKSLREGGGLYLNFAKSVHIPERPYMAPTIKETVEDGSLTAAAMEAFMAAVWG